MRWFFTGKILAIAPAHDDEFRLTLRPETIFKGTPISGMEILTAQRRCLPEMQTYATGMTSRVSPGCCKGRRQNNSTSRYEPGNLLTQVPNPKTGRSPMGNPETARLVSASSVNATST